MKELDGAHEDGLRKTTLVFLLADNGKRICLALKKRGFGAGKWNGSGGKVEPNETIEAAARRECQEETGVLPSLDFRGTLEFYFVGKPEWNQRCFVFSATEWTGELVETEEMLPKWWDVSDIPYDSMWSDDPIWLPGLLSGGKVNHKFQFNSCGELLNVLP